MSEVAVASTYLISTALSTAFVIAAVARDAWITRQEVMRDGTEEYGNVTKIVGGFWGDHGCDQQYPNLHLYSCHTSKTVLAFSVMAVLLNVLLSATSFKKKGDWIMCKLRGGQDCSALFPSLERSEALGFQVPPLICVTIAMLIVLRIYTKCFVRNALNSSADCGTDIGVSGYLLVAAFVTHWVALSIIYLLLLECDVKWTYYKTACIKAAGTMILISPSIVCVCLIALALHEDEVATWGGVANGVSYGLTGGNPYNAFQVCTKQSFAGKLFRKELSLDDEFNISCTNFDVVWAFAAIASILHAGNVLFGLLNLRQPAKVARVTVVVSLFAAFLLAISVGITYDRLNLRKDNVSPKTIPGSSAKKLAGALGCMLPVALVLLFAGPRS